MPNATLVDEIPVANILGEGIQWRIDDASLWWTDILDRKLYRYDPATREINVRNVPEPLGSFAFTRDANVILAAFATGFALFDLETADCRWMEKPPFLRGEGRFNDGRADRQGRFWSGTMMAEPGGSIPAAARLFCMDDRRSLSVHQNGVSISNGLCWSPDGSIMYFADSLKGCIYEFDFDTDAGRPDNKRLFARLPSGGSPDGAAVDSAGNIWSAVWGLGAVFVFDPEGKVITRVAVPTSQPTCVAFGGGSLDYLFVTSARDGLTKKELAATPSSGNVFVYQTDVPGLPEAQFAGALSE